MENPMVLHQPETILERRFGSGGDKLAGHDFRDAHPSGTFIFGGHFVGDVALRNHSEQDSLPVANSHGSNGFIAQVASSIVNGCVVANEVNFPAGTDKIGYFHRILLKKVGRTGGLNRGTSNLDSGNCARCHYKIQIIEVQNGCKEAIRAASENLIAARPADIQPRLARN
jgi:hypothetical protein